MPKLFVFAVAVAGQIIRIFMLHEGRSFTSPSISSYTASNGPKRRIVSLRNLWSSSVVMSRADWGMVLPRNRTIEGNEYTHAQDKLQPEELPPPVDMTPCVPMKPWQTQPHPTCNALHEIDMPHHDSGQFLGQGGWRIAWSYSPAATSVIIKTLKWKRPFHEFLYNKHKVDAMATDRLTSLACVTDIYGYCGMSVLNEMADMGGKSFDKHFASMKATSLQKLEYGRDVATCIADIHGIDGEYVVAAMPWPNATMVHTDMQTSNFVFGKHDGLLKVSDFNAGVLVWWNVTSQTLCRFSSLKRRRSKYIGPEQILGQSNLTEAVDVYALGATLYFLLHDGREPYEHDSKSETSRKKVEDQLPSISRRYRRTNDTVVQALVRASQQCMKRTPNKRPSARQIANDLNAAVIALTS